MVELIIWMMKVASPKSEMVLQVVEMVRFGVFHVGVAGWIFYGEWLERNVTEQFLNFAEWVLCKVV